VAFYSGSIANADAKSGFLAAGITVVGAAGFTQLKHFLSSHPFDGAKSIAAGILLILALVGLGYAALNLVWALNPRTEPPDRFTRFGFPSLVAKSFDFVPDLDAEKQRREAWIQAHVLAEIALKKFRYFQRGLYVFGITAPLLGVASIMLA